MTMVEDKMPSNRIMVMAKVKTTFSDEGLSQKSETNSCDLQCDVWSSLLIRIKKALPTTSQPPFM